MINEIEMMSVLEFLGKVEGRIDQMFDTIPDYIDPGVLANMVAEANELKSLIRIFAVVQQEKVPLMNIWRGDCARYLHPARANRMTLDDLEEVADIMTNNEAFMDMVWDTMRAACDDLYGRACVEERNKEEHE